MCANKLIAALDESIIECERFMEKAYSAKRAIIGANVKNYGQYSFKEASAVKRASMDLTRALVFIRN